MQTCQYAGDPLTEPRSHPWVDTAGRPECRYHDLTRSPELIRTALEDLVPWSHYPAIETLYGLIERLNGTGSPWESNDCEFTGPQAHTTPGAPHALECSGRLMVLLSALERNTSVADVEHETEHLHRRLARRLFSAALQRRRTRAAAVVVPWPACAAATATRLLARA